MQNDLISRSEAYQRMVEETEQSGKCYIELSTIGRLLNDVPNAYNVKKVVAELENDLPFVESDDTGETFIHKVKTIESVRNGGRE